MNTVFLGEDPDDMKWLHDVHGAPEDMKCAILRGNEDAPQRIEAWRTFNPAHTTAPDWVYVPPADAA